MRLPRCLTLGVALSLMACTSVPPKTVLLPLNDEDCAGTESGKGCLTLLFSVTDAERETAGDRCAGFAHWALYAGGAVGPFGPGDNPPLLGNSAHKLDLTKPGAKDALTLPNVDARSYQVLGFISQQGPGHPSVSGDPVTLPSGTFTLAPNTHLEVDVVFNITH